VIDHRALACELSRPDTVLVESPDQPQLTPVEARVIGTLMEKESTTLDLLSFLLERPAQRLRSKVEPRAGDGVGRKHRSRCPGIVARNRWRKILLVGFAR
jgi:hypothetical protein